MPQLPAGLASRWKSLSGAGGIIGVMLLVMSIPATSIYTTLADRHLMKRGWTITGPPCPMGSPPKVTSRPLQTFQYGGVGFSRRAGNASCVALSEGPPFNRSIYRVCQFSSPVIVGVTAAGQTTFYNPGVGRKATITLRGGAQSCVVAGWFTR